MIRQTIIASIVLLLLTGCSSTRRPPVLEANGYIADQGVMRIWRKVSGDGQPIGMMSVYTPYSGDTIATSYEYTDGNLSLVRSTVQVKDGQRTVLRLDDQGNPSFMQRQMVGYNEQLSSDDILRLQYEEQKIRNISTSLSAGKIRLYQGRIHNGVITTCAGEDVRLNFSQPQQAWLERRVRNGGKLSLAWLSAPRGLELLLVANEDFCQWEPTLEIF
ncbi:DUF1481 domain-containing protein [Budvicia diplopodorum]|uniref:DUF1481 domain-containing protein n=1 Tax=Budvicia diplopodorum TaxID=1119056 RepID=UPI001357ECF0|nr:DUF1481 domain-containing protein [Budvicia diplopodorum]